MIFTPTLVGGESIVRLLNGRTFESEFNVPHAARAIVVGSGIAGLSAAIALLKAGCEVALYERSAVLAEVGAGISLWSNALRSLDKIGAGEAVRKHIEPLRTSEFRGKEGRVVAVSFPASALEEALGSHPVIGMIHRARLVESLASCLPLGVARYGYEAIAIQDKGSQVEVEFANGHSDVADVLIGADGIHSRTRSLLWNEPPPRYSGYTCFRGITEAPACIESGYLGEWWGRGRRVGITTLKERKVYWWATVNAPQGTRTSDKRDRLCNEFRTWAEPVPELFRTTPEDAIIQNDVIDRRPSRNWYRGNCLLIGDAAHPVTPNLGQGGCMAIEDASCLLHLFSMQLPVDQLLPRFLELRKKRVAAINLDSYRLGKVGQWSGSVACWIRDNTARSLLPILGPSMLIKHSRNVDRFLVE